MHIDTSEIATVSTIALVQVGGRRDHNAQLDLPRRCLVVPTDLVVVWVSKGGRDAAARAQRGLTVLCPHTNISKHSRIVQTHTLKISSSLSRGVYSGF